MNEDNITIMTQAPDFLVVSPSAPDSLSILESNADDVSVNVQGITVVSIGTQNTPPEQVTHYQTTPSSAWTVNHNLGRITLTSVTSVGGVQMMAEVVHTSSNQLLVYFDSPTIGTVTCI